MAEVLAIDRSTVYRHLKQLEDLRLIKSMRTREKTIYVVLPVPSPRPESGSTPLFDAIEIEMLDQDSVWSPVASERMSPDSEIDSSQRNSSVASVQPPVSSLRPASRNGENRNKEEQDAFNKTQEQDFRGNKTLERSPSEPSAAQIQECAVRIVQLLGMPETQANLKIVEAGVIAEIRYAGLSPESAAQIIAEAAMDDREKGIPINKFYFEDARWRTPNGGPNKAGQRFERINRARERAIENIKARSRSKELDH
jgi:hypothetical protein